MPSSNERYRRSRIQTRPTNQPNHLRLDEPFPTAKDDSPCSVGSRRTRLTRSAAAKRRSPRALFRRGCSQRLPRAAAHAFESSGLAPGSLSSRPNLRSRIGVPSPRTTRSAYAHASVYALGVLLWKGVRSAILEGPRRLRDPRRSNRQAHCRASGAATEVTLTRAAKRRQVPGVTPSQARKVRFRCASSEKPQAAAVSRTHRPRSM